VQIPLLSRIIAVTDTYERMSPDLSRMRLRAMAGIELDPKGITAFEAVRADASQEYRQGTAPQFRLEAVS
jgi:HD-GYP domain-containing protein (c-di-GMP phosphodiesterase class II)